MIKRNIAKIKWKEINKKIIKIKNKKSLKH